MEIYIPHQNNIGGHQDLNPRSRRVRLEFVCIGIMHIYARGNTNLPARKCVLASNYRLQ